MAIKLPKCLLLISVLVLLCADQEESADGPSQWISPEWHYNWPNFTRNRSLINETP